MGEQVAPVRTPYTIEQVKPLLADAWERRFGERIRPDVLRLILALIDVETGDGVPGSTTMPNSFHHNMGNLTIASQFLPTTKRKWFVLKGDEGPGSGSQAKEHFYKAFGSFEEAADEQVAQLTRDTRPHWHAGLLTGDPEEFIRALNGQNGPPAYFEAGFDRYLRTYLTRWNKYPIETAPPSPRPPPAPEPEPSPVELPKLTGGQADTAATVAIVMAVLGLGALLLLSQLTKTRTA